MRSQSTWRAVEQKQGPAGTADHLGEETMAGRGRREEGLQGKTQERAVCTLRLSAMVSGMGERARDQREG